MKRALSLIIVLTMVLCMIPFSAFAAEFNVGTDFIDGTITLTGSEEISYLWTATEDGTLEIFAEPVQQEVAEGEEAPAVAQPYILVDGDDYVEGGFAITAGKSYEITIGDDLSIGGEIKVWTKFTGLPGTETNPYVMYNPASGMGDGNTTVSVEPGASVYYELKYFAGTIVKISGVGVKAVKVFEDLTIDGTEDGYVEFEFGANELTSLVKITNKSDAAQTYTIEGIVPAGTMNNPEVIVAGEYTVSLGAYGEYWYEYVAEAAGQLSIGVAASTTITDAEGKESVIDCWKYTVNPFSGGETHYCDDDVIVNPQIVDVAAGDKVIFVVGTYNGHSADVITTVSFEEATEEPEAPIVIEALPYEATHTGDYEQAYTYTATENGYLHIVSEGWMELHIGMNWAEPYAGGYVLPMNAGDVAEINLYAYYNEETFTYSFSWLSEIVPDGSPAYPFVIDTLLNGDVTLTNEGENAVYYAYTAEKSGKIFNSFFGESMDVTEDEVVSFYVPAGEPVTVGYLPPVAVVDGVDYYDLQAAINAAAESGTATTVTLASDATVSGCLNILPNVTLDLQAYSLTADYLIGLKGSAITGTAISTDGKTGGKLYVPKENIILATDAPTNAKGQPTIPVWKNDHFIFSLVLFNNQTLTTTEDNNGTSVVKFRVNATGYVKSNIFSDGTSDNEVSVIVRVSYTDPQAAGNIEVSTDYKYDDGLVAYTMKNNYLTAALVNCNTYQNLEFSILVITEAGVAVIHEF